MGRTLHGIFVAIILLLCCLKSLLFAVAAIRTCLQHVCVDVQDMLLDIEMERLEPRIWRRFRLCGAISLRTLQDKVQ